MSATLTIERVVPGGDGLGRLDGVVVLVPGTLPGDRVVVETASTGKGFLRGRLLSVAGPGPARRPDAEVCPRAVDGSCGGCDWPAARLEAHAALKTELVLDALARVGRFPATELPTPGFTGSPRGYRLRSRLHLDAGGRIGFYAPRSNEVSDLAECELVSPALLARLPEVRRALADGGAPPGELETLEGRDGSPLIAAFRPADTAEARTRGLDPASLVRSLLGPLDGVVVLDGEGRKTSAGGLGSLTLAAGGAEFRVSATSFFQGNRFLLDAFLEETRAALATAAGTDGAPRETLDLYAGAGFLTRPLLETGALTEAVERDPSSSADLAANLAAWRREGLPARSRAHHETAEAHLARLSRAPDVVVADPPRAGLSPRVRKELLRLRPAHLFLVSCDPATLARDLGVLRDAYRIVRLSLLDLFPGTHHVETLALLERRQRSVAKGRTR